MRAERTYTGRCLCGAVELRVVGRPAVMGFCHCGSCRAWSGSPLNAVSLWLPSAVNIVRGGTEVGSFQRTERTIRKWCRHCGGHLLTEHPTWGVVAVLAGVLREFPFDPVLHVNYAETVLHLRDGLPKLKDLPAEMGGSGVSLPE
ncbi:MAG TPA: GFA family protein [Myxococcaceae bacterium]|nr:GFA family protein [Myxococcaceae bacterium]